LEQNPKCTQRNLRADTVILCTGSNFIADCDKLVPPIQGKVVELQDVYWTLDSIPVNTKEDTEI
jgi:hypothetical protein